LPEGPEVRIMTDYLNQEFSTRSVVRVEKSPISKNKCDLSILDNKTWQVRFLCRGKQMMIIFSNGNEEHRMTVGFARIGLIEFYDLNNIDQVEFDKKGMLRLYSVDRVYFISDFTRYAIWKWSDIWHERRSPDIVLEHNAWRHHLHSLRQNKLFKKKFDRPVFEIMSDQYLFNGVGNFSKCEILARVRFSPFTTLTEVVDSDILRNDFFDVIKDTLSDIHRHGGLQFQYWTNPFRQDRDKFDKWVMCYRRIRKAYFMKDSVGRNFWFMKKWLLDYIEYVKDSDVQDTRLLEKIYRLKRNKKWL
jgi:formamidopyrimidine-DNA glycosylase